MKHRSYILKLITILLLALWIPVALDKFWDLEGFRRTLLSQPFPDAWADVLYWLLPVLELVCAALLIGSPTTHNSKRLRLGFALSAFLMAGFTLFILFGVLGWYAQRPCGCGSVISGLTWEQHLWFNIAFLSTSLLGWWLLARYKHGPAGPGSHPGGGWQDRSYFLFSNRAVVILDCRDQAVRIVYPRRFAVFPRKAGIDKYYPKSLYLIVRKQFH